jgi:hypothetical protein
MTSFSRALQYHTCTVCTVYKAVGEEFPGFYLLLLHVAST